MGRGCLLGLALFGVNACALEPSYQWLPTDGAQSVLLLEPSKEGLNITALPVEGAARWTFSEGAQPPIHLLGYGRSLSELGLEAGPVRIEAQGRPLPVPSWVRAWSSEDDAPRFRLAPGLPPLALELRIAGTDPCPRLQADPVILAPDMRRPLFFGAIDGDRALLGTHQGVFVVESATISLSRELSPEAAYTGLYVPALGAEVYVARGDGQVFRGRPGEGFEPVAQLPKVEPAALSGFGAGPSLVLFSMSSSSAVHRWEAGQVETQRVELDSLRSARIAAFGPRGVVLYRGSRHGVVELAEWPNPPREHPLELQPDDELRGLRNIVGLGPVLATRDGLAFRRTDTTWVLHFDAPTATTPFVLEQAFGGTLFGGEDAVLGLRMDDGLECGSASYATAGQDAFKNSAAVGDVVYLIDDEPIAVASPMVRLRALK